MLRYRLRELNRTDFSCPEGMSPMLHALFIRRDIASEEEAMRFLHPSTQDFHDPFLLSDMSEAVMQIRAALDAGTPICVYGDYDVDGVSASALLSSHLKSIGGKVEVYLPSRHTEGYGLNAEAIASIAEWAKLIVTVDCGITSVDLIDYAKSLGLQVIVTDHHRPAEELPHCLVVNPLLNDYPFPYLCGAGVAFKLVHALSGLEAALEYVDIAALATVADVVSLTGENRVIVKLGLERINAAARLGIGTLIEVAGLSDKTITAGHIGFQLGPRLNAGGRIGSARRSFDLLTATDPVVARALADELESENTDRRQIEQQILAEAEAQMQNFDFLKHRAIVLAGDDWNSGVIGLAASRLVEKYHYPTILLSQREGVLTGSCRSISGVDIHAALTAVQQHLVRFGGHKQAAGLTLLAENLDVFRDALDEYLRNAISPICYVPEQEYDLEIDFDALTEGFVAELDAFQPTGMGNPAPVFRSAARLVEARAVGAEGAHLRVCLSNHSVRKNGIFFRAGALANRLAENLDVLYCPKLDHYMGRTSVQLELKAVNTGDFLSEISAKIEDEVNLQRDFLTQMFYNREINFFDPETSILSESQLAALLADDPQGTLVLGGDLASVARLMHQVGEASLDLYYGEVPDDPRAFNAICCYPPTIPTGYRRIVRFGFPEGLPLPTDAEIFATSTRAPWLRDLPDLDQLREVYKATRRLFQRPVYYRTFGELTHLISTDTGLSNTSATASLLVLHEMQLIVLSLDSCPIQLKLNEMRKTDPETSAVWRMIQRWRS